jgi:hypothetical protein
MNPGTTPQKATTGGSDAVLDIDTWGTAGDMLQFISPAVPHVSISSTASEPPVVAFWGVVPGFMRYIFVKLTTPWTIFDRSLFKQILYEDEF